MFPKIRRVLESFASCGQQRYLYKATLGRSSQTPTTGGGKTVFPSSTTVRSPSVTLIIISIGRTAGDDIPMTIKNCRKANSGTHPVIADIYVKGGYQRG